MNLKDRILMKTAWILPKDLIKWCCVRAFSHASSGCWGRDDPNTIGYGVLLRRWYQDNNKEFYDELYRDK